MTPSSGDASFRLLDVHIKTKHGKSARKSTHDDTTLKPNFDLELDLQEDTNNGSSVLTNGHSNQPAPVVEHA
jgi:hypothetical protein